MTKHGCGRWAAAVMGVLAAVAVGERRPSSGATPVSPAGELPFQLLADFLVVVEGRIGNVDGLNLAIDTGTRRTVIDAALARRLGGAVARLPMEVFGETFETEAIVLESLSFGPVRAANRLVLAADLRPQQGRFGVRLDALVGLDVLGDRCFAIDYRTRRLSFSCTPASPRRAPFSRDAPYPLVEATIDGSPYRLFVDTGSEAVIVFDSAVPPLTTFSDETEVSGAHLMGTVRLRRFTAERFLVGGHSLGQAPVFILGDTDPRDGYDGLLATRRLPGSRVQFDFPRGLLSWQ